MLLLLVFSSSPSVCLEAAVAFAKDERILVVQCLPYVNEYDGRIKVFCVFGVAI